MLLNKSHNKNINDRQQSCWTRKKPRAHYIGVWSLSNGVNLKYSFCIYFILCVFLSGCSSSDSDSVEELDMPDESVYIGNFGRVITINKENGSQECLKELLTLTEEVWELKQFHYIGDNCDTFFKQWDFSGVVKSISSGVNNGLAVENVLVVDVDWVNSAPTVPFEYNDQMFPISKAILWDGILKTDHFELIIYPSGDSFYSNTFTTLINTFLSIDDSLSIDLDAEYQALSEVDETALQELQP
jgi:hypothetical protein